jgi:hypothetical protein
LFLLKESYLEESVNIDITKKKAGILCRMFHRLCLLCSRNFKSDQLKDKEGEEKIDGYFNPDFWKTKRNNNHFENEKIDH